MQEMGRRAADERFPLIIPLYNKRFIKGISMKFAKYLCVLVLLCGIFSAHVYAKSPVWKISKNGHHLFLGGTIHLLAESDYPPPGAFETAYKSSMILVIEADLQQFGTPEFQQKLLLKTMYSGKDNITQFLKPDTMRALKTHLTDRGIPVESMLKLKPGILSTTLTMIELKKLGLAGTGVDEFFILKAIQDSKEIKYLETVSEQLEFFAKMGEGNEDELIQYTLNEIKDLPRLFGSMKKAWRNGDNDQLQKVAMDPWTDRFPKLYNSLLIERNNNWVTQIERMLKTKEIEFVLFGTLHLAGEEGILAQLDAHGYKIENQ